MNEYNFCYVGYRAFGTILLCLCSLYQFFSLKFFLLVCGFLLHCLHISCYYHKYT